MIRAKRVNIKKVFLVAIILFFLAQFVNASCGPCGSTITSSCTLDSDLNALGSCFTVAANNITIDGDGYTITGDGTGTGVVMSTAASAFFNIRVQSLNITNFENGIYVQNSPDSEIISNGISSIGQNGVHVINSEFIEIAYNNISSTGDGISVFTTLFGNIHDNTITNSNTGVQFSSDSNSNILSSNYICSNTIDISDDDSNSGSGNTCDVIVNWQDTGSLGCTFTCTDDSDGDGVVNDIDNCPFAANPDQENNDSDDLGDVCDNCPENDNPGQEDIDSDHSGDVCDLCPNDRNKSEPGTCGCGTPDSDMDLDGEADCVDNCPDHENPDQKDWDDDGEGDNCDCDDGFKGDFEIGADCGNLCPESCPPCIPLVKNGKSYNKIDIVFVPDIDYQDNIDTFIDDAVWLVENSYLGATEFYNNRCKFNFYYYPHFGDYEPICEKFDLPSEVETACSFADTAAIIFTGGGRACSGPVYSTPPNNKKTPVHELGHKIFGLRDEYASDGGYGEVYFLSNIFESKDNCEAKSINPEDCKEFCPDYNYYPDDTTQQDLCRQWWLMIEE